MTGCRILHHLLQSFWRPPRSSAVNTCTTSHSEVDVGLIYLIDAAGVKKRVQDLCAKSKWLIDVWVLITAKTFSNVFIQI